MLGASNSIAYAAAAMDIIDTLWFGEYNKGLHVDLSLDLLTLATAGMFGQIRAVARLSREFKDAFGVTDRDLIEGGQAAAMLPADASSVTRAWLDGGSGWNTPSGTGIVGHLSK